jgi:exosome complex RNA-binding protein Csl4
VQRLQFTSAALLAVAHIAGVTCRVSIATISMPISAQHSASLWQAHQPAAQTTQTASLSLTNMMPGEQHPWPSIMLSISKRALLLQVVMYDCFRPGDIVRAKVLSLGDARSYHLSTADNSLGVVRAKSLAGEQQRRLQQLHEFERCARA